MPCRPNLPDQDLAASGRRPWLPSLSLTLLLALLLGVLPVAGRAAGAPAPSAPVAAEGAPWNLTIFHTNDMHGSFLPEPATWRQDGAEVGGMIALAWHLGQQRRTAPASLLLDAGDFMTGNPICDMELDGVAGGALVDMMALVGYDASVPGNHEFDKGLPNARRLAARASWPIMAADLLDADGQFPFGPGPVVIERGGLRIGIMGVTCAGLFSVTGHGATGGLSLRDQERAVREQIADLEPRADLLVLISHDGVEGDEDLARRLAGSGLDVIVGGHSHTRLPEPRLVDGIIIVQAGSHLKYLGRLDLEVKDKRVVAYHGQLIELLAAGATAGDSLTAMVRTWQDRIDAAYGQVIGRLVTPWARHGGESNVGDWLTDRIRERAGADVAFLNSGTIRKDMPAGPVTLLDVHELLPFANRLVVVRMTGRELLGAMRQNVRGGEEGHGGPAMQVSGIRYGWSRTEEGPQVHDPTVGGRPLDPEATYTVAMPDYVAMKSDRYLGLKSVAFEEIGVGLTDAIVEAVRAAGEIDARLDGRIRRIEP